MIVIVMGVVGAGKTTVGKLLAEELGWKFVDADAYHPASNVEKIRNGIALTDQDREPWLDLLQNAIRKWIGENSNEVLACSALKSKYREKLDVGPEVRFVYLKGTQSLIGERLRARQGHFAGESILASQLADLQEPQSAVVVDIAEPPQEIVEKIRKGLGLG
jgi:gluconokinase